MSRSLRDIKGTYSVDDYRQNMQGSKLEAIRCGGKLFSEQALLEYARNFERKLVQFQKETVPLDVES